MKRDGKDFIMHGIFVDDMKHISTAKYLLDEFLEKYSGDLEITGEHHRMDMESFFGLDVEQWKSKISLHLDAYIRKMLGIYKRIRARRCSDRSQHNSSRGIYLHPKMCQKCQIRSDKYSIGRW